MIIHQHGNSKGNYHYNIRTYTDTVIGFHFHNSYEIIYVIDGAVECTVNGITNLLAKGSFGMCLPNEVHAYNPKDDTVYWVIVFSKDYVQSFDKLICGKNGEGFAFKCSDAVMEYVTEKLMRESQPSKFTLKSCLYALCEEYLNSVKLVPSGVGRTQTMAQITDYIKENHKSDITLSDIAKLLGYDYHYLSRYFHKTFNMSFKAYLNMYRLDTAEKLMTESDKKLVDVALESGFQSLRTFNDCFKKQFGITPTEYKRSSL